MRAHGEDHWRRVAMNGLDLAAEVGADPLLVVLFAIFHDAMRFNDEEDHGHGTRGGFLACCLNDQLLFLSEDRLDLLDRACAGHADGQTSTDATIGVCWDADRLELVRIWGKINPKDMSTAPGRTDVAQARAQAMLTSPPEWAAVFERLARMMPKREPARLEPARPEPARLEPARPEPARLEPARLEPTRLEPARPEPSRPEPVGFATAAVAAATAVVAAIPVQERPPAPKPPKPEPPPEPMPASLAVRSRPIPPASEPPPTSIKPIERRVYETATLMDQHPPVIVHALKKVILSIACPQGAEHSGRMTYSRWPEMPLPDSVDLNRAVDRVAVRDGFYDYRLQLEPGAAAEWHVNFADPELFGSYGIHYMAQDELQVAEHPGLGALREALLAEGLAAVTVEAGRPTPVLVTGAKRRVQFATETNPDEGRPIGLYGRNFRQSDADAVRRATTVIDPPTVTHVIAIAALANGSGRYTRDQLDYTLTTAHTGFRAAVMESGKSTGLARQVVVHSGFWGAGAFGGNPVLMTVLQIVAAEMAGVGILVLYAGSPPRWSALERALSIARELLGPGRLSTSELLDRVDAMAFRWGAGDGN